MSTTIWYYGDQRITGNYTQQQNFTLLGPTFYSVNVLTASATSNIGASSAPWDNLYVKSSNVTVLQSPILATLNVNTPSAKGSPYIANIFGNVYTSNSISALSTNTTTLNTGTLSLLSISRTLGFGTATPPAATLWASNIFMSGTLNIQNVFSTNINTISVITNSLVTPMTSLYILGNALFTNALTTSNIFADSANGLNVTAANLTTASLFSNINSYSLNTSSALANTLSIGTYDPYTGLNINGNAYISNALTAPTIFAVRATVQTASNVVFFSGPVGFNTPGNLNTGVLISGNAFISNSITTPNIFSSTMLVPTVNAYSLVGQILTTPFNFNFNFTNMGASGSFGPTSVTYSSLPLGWTALSGGIQYWTVPTTGNYSFIVAGAGSYFAGSQNSVKTGYGFVLNASYTLIAGQILALLVGQQGFQSDRQCGGSGGTFVALVQSVGALSSAVPLFVAGGAGGPGYEGQDYANQSINGAASTTGQPGGPFAPGQSGAGGVGPSGGANPTSSAYSWSDSGAGFSGNGVFGGESGNPSNFARAFINGGFGDTNTVIGGFGGGGASIGYGAGGGGGGYGGGGSGGSDGAGTGGGGGGSYSVTDFPAAGSATNSGQGYISINLLVGGSLVTLGNAYVSNSVTAGSIVAATANVTTVNASAGTIPILNMNVIAAYTVEDLTRRSPHLVPSATNGPIIQAWISATCNASNQPQRSFWLTDVRPAFSNTSPSTPYYYKGGVFLPDGRVLFVPFHTTAPGFYQPKTLTFSTAPATGLTSGNFAYGVLLPTGNVIFCPQTSNVGLYNPLDYTFSNCTSLPGGSYSGTLSPTGNVVFVPTGVPSNIIHWNYTTGALANCYSFSAPYMTTKWVTPVTTSLSNSTQGLFHIIWSNELGIFCLTTYSSGGNDYSLISSDGLTWTPGGTQNLSKEPAWSPDLGIFCGFSGSTPYTSPDGLNWTPGSSLSSSGWSSIEWAPGRGVFCSFNYTTGYSAISTDGVNWTSGNISYGSGWGQIVWSPQLGVFCAINDEQYESAISRDGLNWTTGSSSGGGPVTNSWSPELGIFCTGSGTRTSVSKDGLNWTLGSIITSTVSVIHIVWSSQLGLFCMTSFDRTVWTSTNGLTWNQASLPSGLPAGINGIQAAWAAKLGVFCVVFLSTSGPLVSIVSTPPAPIQSGSILLPNGNVLGASPGTSNIIQYNPSTLAASNLTVGTDGFNGLVLTPNGNVIGVPQNSNVLVINPSSFTSSNVTVPSVFFGGGCLTPSGNVIFAPSGSSSNVGMFDSIALTYSNSTPAGASFSSATLVPNGQVVFSGGVLDTMTPVPIEFCLNPYINKF